jgi:hypothetical protein
VTGDDSVPDEVFIAAALASSVGGRVASDPDERALATTRDPWHAIERWRMA